jgi:ubiquinone biosynthesis protein
MEHDDFTVQLKLKEADRYAQKLDKAFSRLSISLVLLSLSIVIAGTIIGLSLTDVGGSDFIEVTSIILRSSLILAVITFVALIIAIFRSKRI